MHKSTQKVTNVKLGLNPEETYRKVLFSALGECSTLADSKLAGWLRARRYDLLLEWSGHVCPQKYDTPSSYFEAVQMSHLIKKYPFPKTMIPDLDPESEARKKFSDAEMHCYWVNRDWASRTRRFDPYGKFWQRARGYIERVLGSTPDISKIYSQCDITPGAAIGTHGNKTNLARKLVNDWSVSTLARPHAVRALWDNLQIRDYVLYEPGRDVVCYCTTTFGDLFRSRIQITDYNKIDFVPKTAKTHRGIAVEPFLNSYIQNGIDREMRARLRKRAQINLSDQRLNQVLAEFGSRDDCGRGRSLTVREEHILKTKFGSLDRAFQRWSTIDLSAASDSITIELVRNLLPPDWFELLNAVRSLNYMDQGEIHSYQKFCSMGNGFCFPLESLIFSALCYSALLETNANPYDFNVYGDDILIPQGAALLLIELLDQAGFATNTEKSFIVGSFKESCGSDWYSGVDVRPCTLDKPISTIREAHAFHNTTWRNDLTEAYLAPVREVLRSLVSQPLLRPGVEPGDSAFSVPLDVAMGGSRVFFDRKKHAWSWVELQAEPVLDYIEVDDRPTVDRLIWASVIRGADSRKPFTCRYSSKIRTKKICRPYWDDFSVLALVKDEFGVATVTLR